MCARSFQLDPSRTEIGQTIHLHNGIDSMIPFSRVANIMTESFGVPIAYDGSEEAFLRDLGDIFRACFKRDDAAEYFLAYCKFELGHVQRLGADLLNGEPDITPEKLGFTARSLHDWLVDHRDTFVPTTT